MITRLISIGLLLPMFLGAQTNRLFFVGHSLSDHIPEMLVGLADSDDRIIEYGYAQIIGSPLRYQWSCLENPGNWPGNFPDGGIYAFYDPDHGLASGDYDQLILNEGVPRLNNEWGIQETYRYVDSFYQYATLYNPDIKVHISELWHCLLSDTPTGCDYDEDSNPWRQRLDDDLPMWESAVDFINDKYSPTFPVRLIPSGQALAALYDSIDAGVLPGISSIDQVFEDRIHGNDTIRYLVACVNYASLTRRSPIGLSHELKNWWGGDFGVIPVNMAKTLQNIAWETVCNYEHNDINCDVTTNSVEVDLEDISIYPNPGRGEFKIDGAKDHRIRIADIHGSLILKDVLTDDVSTIDLSSQPKGVYILEIFGDNKLCSKRLCKL